MFLTNYFLQNDENLLQKSCVVKQQEIFRQKEKFKTQNFKMNYLFIYLFPPSIFSCCSKGDQSATREFSQIWL
jgi:hypothetical protein